MQQRKINEIIYVQHNKNCKYDRILKQGVEKTNKMY